MAENVVIRIDVNADTRGIDKVRRKLMQLRAEAEALDKKFAKLSGSASKLNTNLGSMSGSLNTTSKGLNNVNRQSGVASAGINRFGNTLNRNQNKIKRFDQVLNRFGKSMQNLAKFMGKGFLLVMGSAAGAIMAVNAAFAVGRFAVRAWNQAFSMAMSAGAAAAASFVAALSAVAAGQRQFAAAAQSARYGGFSAGTTASMAQLRNLEKNQRIAVLGSEAISGAFAAISRNTQVTSVLNRALTAMGDFAAASADPEKAFVAAGDFLGQLTKGGRLTAEMITAAKDIGPEFQHQLMEAMKANKTGSKELIAALIGGDLSGGVAGTLSESNKTLFGTVKRNFGLIKSDFADMGQEFLPGFTVAIEKMSRSLRTGLVMISGTLNAFVQGSMIDTLVNGFDRIVVGGAKLFNEYLPKASGLVGQISGFAQSIGDGFERVRDTLAPLQGGARVLMDAFGPLFNAMVGGFGGSVMSLNEMLIGDSDRLISFGQSLLSLFKSVSNVFTEIKEAIFAVLPLARNFISELAKGVQVVADLLGSLNGAGPLGSLLGLAGAGMGYRALGNMGVARGNGRGHGLRERLGGAFGGAGPQNMVVNANVVTVNGSTAASAVGSSATRGGATTPAGGGLMSRVRSGAGSVSQAATRALSSPAGQMAGQAAAIGGAMLLAQNASTGRNAAGGAVLGAGIGTMIAPGVGTLVGGVIGGAGGLLLEASPWGAERRQRDNARAGAHAVAGEAGERIRTGLSGGDYLSAQAAMTGLGDKIHGLSEFMRIQALPDDERYPILNSGTNPYAKITNVLNEFERTEWMGDWGAFLDTLKTDFSQMQTEYGPILDEVTRNFERLGTVTGMTDDQIQMMANTLGIDMTSAVTEFGDVVSHVLGVEIPSSLQDMSAAVNNAFIQSINDIVDPIFKLEDTRKAVDQSQVATLEALRSGTYDRVIGAQQFRDVANYEMLQSTDPVTGQMDALKALNQMNTMLGAGGAAYQAGGSFAGFGDSQFAQDQQKMIDQLTANTAKTVAPQLLGSMATMMAESTGGDFGLSLKDIQGANFGGMSIDQLNRLETVVRDMQSGATSYGDDYFKQYTPQSFGEMMKGMFGVNIGYTATPGLVAGAAQPAGTGDFGPGGGNFGGGDFGLTTAASAIQTSSNQGATAIQRGAMMGAGSLMGAADQLRGAAGAVRAIKIQVPSLDPFGDTPTSRFDRTMSRANQMNKMVGGKRTVTSGMRFDNLGSINSDHATGGALDVTGQNLGGFASAVKSNGGFAEFHGSGGNRHLHTVPGTGDAATPNMQPTSAGGSGGAVTIHVYPSAGMDEEALAQKTARAIYDAQRSLAERR